MVSIATAQRAIGRALPRWWLFLITGIGWYGRSAVLLVAWVAAFAIIRAVRDIVFSFRVHALQHAVPPAM